MTTPSVRQVERWRPEALAELAASWVQLATLLGGAGDDLAGHDRTVWTGTSANQAWQRLAQHREQAVTLAGVVHAAAKAAQRGAAGLTEARTTVTDLLADLRRRGYQVADDGSVIDAAEIFTHTPELTSLTIQLQDALHRLGATDNAVAGDIAAALNAPAAPIPDRPNPVTGPTAAEVVANWPTMAQDSIAQQIASMDAEQRDRLVQDAPQQVGNTDGVPWPLRIAANRINIAAAIDDQQRIIELPENAKIDAVLAQGFAAGLPLALGGAGLGLVGDDRRRAMVLADPKLRAAALAAHDWAANRRIDFYRGLLGKSSDPTRRSTEPVDRQILAFDPQRAALVELHGDLDSATSLGVLVPGMNTTVLDSATNTRTARRFVAEGRGDVAMITYLGGPFPAGADLTSALLQASDNRYALDMAPRLVAFSEDVNRTVDATGRHIPVTYLGHSYGGSILGTAERLGLTADRTVYVEAAGAGVGVHDAADWHNRNPDVERYSMTAPGDPITVVQGLPGGPHGADPDELRDVWRLPTGRRLDGTEMSGWDAHGDVVDEPSDAWRALLEVITGRR